SVITVDPHLHRRHSMSEIYSVPCNVLHAAPLISDWIKSSVINPVLVGPDSESEQWVSKVAADANAPFIVLEKKRRGDADVEVTVPQVELYHDHTPVLVDDIISTARTMIETVKHLKRASMKPPVCVGVHGIFAGTAYQDLKQAGTGQIVTTDTVSHISNGIEIARMISDALI
ncbi:MAG TPA: phosphoribosyltransferase family protein, partial [Cyclobacteriaceae bacterium]|nr:phosphoribosyltransferase family protein [Cyclobacteriaceae bacterium]